LNPISKTTNVPVVVAVEATNVVVPDEDVMMAPIVVKILEAVPKDPVVVTAEAGGAVAVETTKAVANP
jgi:hypothetical protein